MEVYQLIISVLVIVVTMVATWVNISSRVTILETKQVQNDLIIIEIRALFKELQSGQTQIMVKLENKKDR